MEAPFHYVVLRTFCYPTEIRDRVREALLFLAYGKTDEDRPVKLDEHSIEGSFGNKIKIMEIKIEKANDIKNFCKHALPLINKQEIDGIVDNDCFLRLKFSKEKAMEKLVYLAYNGNIISVKGKIKSYPSSRKNAIAAMEKAVEEYRNN
ncbi:MAG: hypothetical protein GWP10_07355 [Nitrospiraceae bacterium]|nr:hypothetical protein [Nitrospiraceae bacterium]